MTINYYSRHRDLNTGPADLQSDALPLSYVCALEDVAFIIINIYYTIASYIVNRSKRNQQGYNDSLHLV